MSEREILRRNKIERVKALLEKADDEIIKYRMRMRQEKPLKGEARKVFEFLSSWARQKKAKDLQGSFDSSVDK